MNLKEPTIKIRKILKPSLHFLLCGMLLSSSFLPFTTAFAATEPETTDPSQSTLPSNAPSLSIEEPIIHSIDILEEKEKEGSTELIVSNEADTYRKEKEVKSHDSSVTGTETSDERLESYESEVNIMEGSEDQSVESDNSQLKKAITATWGTAPVSFDENSGILTVSAGTIGTESAIGSILKNNVKKIIFLDGVKAPINSAFLFDRRNFNKLTSIEGKLDTSNVTNMSCMFINSRATSLDVSNWDTSNVTDMSGMFKGSSITSLDVSNWDTSDVADMSTMFYLAQVTSLDVSNWDTSNVTDMSALFASTKVTSLDVSNWNTSNVVNMATMFIDTKVTSLDISSWDTSNVTSMSGMFRTTQVPSLDISNWDTSSVTSMSNMFSISQVTSLDVSNWDTSNVISMSGMFRTTQVTSLDISNWDTSNVTDMSVMFSNSQVTSLDVSNWDTLNVINMSNMFSNSQVPSLDVSSWDTSNVTNMSNMFSNSQVTSLDVTGWDTSNVVFFDNLFTQSRLIEIKLGDKSTFTGAVNLPEPDTAIGIYSGGWKRIEPVSPAVTYVSSQDFMEKYDGKQPGTYVWEEISAKVKAKDLTVYYQDTDGNEINKSKTVSGNIGDTYDVSTDEYKLEIKGYTFKKIKDSSTGIFSDIEQSVIYIYTKDLEQESDQNQEQEQDPINKNSAEGLSINGKNTVNITNNDHSNQKNSLPKTGEATNLIAMFAGFVILIIASSAGLFECKQYK
ncbi:BspA family leucine-rich repeat surface protein [Isobaculum melis]|uniref:LPXTG-motif cell wall anchor domain-containing protein n=1 Tax=Isobaculum melis TaxID=142588 RepID=A0A1H9UGG5_9LACT|nr:BspA family leucine-rich repeat surface protein [Isobaculum melis]SES08525.1 LPXTG-motif cell wall anchor domain-containing protein [Isobaculum melis]